MKFTQLKESLKAGAKPIYLLEGEELYFTDHGEQMLRQAFLGEDSFNFIAFSGEDLKGAKLKTLVDALLALPLFGAWRMVKVTEFYPSEKEYQAYLKAYFETPVSSTIFLIVNHGGKKSNAADLKKKPNVTVVDCARAEEETVARWVYLTLKRAGIAAEAAVCGMVARYCLSDMARVESETKKLIAYGSDSGKITEEDVRNLVYKDAEYKIYEMSNALSRKNYAEFYAIKEELMSKGYDENSILSVLCSYFRTLYELKRVKGSNAALAQALDLKEYAVRKNREQAEKFSESELFSYYQGIYQAMSDMRMGKLSPSGAMELVIAQIFFKRELN